MARKQAKLPMEKPMALSEMRLLLMRKEAQLQTCIGYNKQWQEVAQGLERQKNELLGIVEQLQAEKEHWKRLATERVQ